MCLRVDKVIITKIWNVSRILNVTFLRKFKRPISRFQIEVFFLAFCFLYFFSVHYFSFTLSHFQALLAVTVFGIKVEFSDKCLQLRDKPSCSWVSRGCCEPPWRGLGRSLINCPISCILSHRRCDLSGLKGTILHEFISLN